MIRIGVIWLVAPILVVSVNVDENFYMNEGENIGYAEGSIIKEIENVSIVQCAHQCRRNVDCKHTAFHDGTGKCKLLQATNFTNSGTSGENIYSAVEMMTVTCT